MYRYKRSIKLSRERQLYVYTLSRMYGNLTPRKREYIDRLCRECGGDYSAALFEFVTTDATATALELKHHISRATLYRCVKKYYESFLSSC